MLFNTKFFIITLIFFAFTLLSAQTQDNFNKFLTAQEFEQSGYYDRAKTLYEEVYAAEPGNFQYFESIIRIYTQTKEYDKIIRIIEDRLSANPQDINLYGILGKIYFLKGDEKKAYDIWDKAATLIPNNDMGYRHMANFAMERRAFQKAIDLLEKGKVHSKNKYVYSYDLSNLYMMTMRYKDAAKEYLDMLNFDEGQLGTVISLLGQHTSKNGVIGEVIQYAEENPVNNNSYDYFMFWLYKEAKNFTKAFELIKEIDDSREANGRQLYEFAVFLFDNRHYPEAELALHYIIENKKNFEAINYAKLFIIKTKEILLDISSFEESNSASFSLNNTNKEQINEIIRLYDELINEYPGTQVAVEGSFRKGCLLFLLNNLDESKISFQKSLQPKFKNPFYVPALEKLSSIAIIKGDLTAAETNYLAIINDKSFTEEERNTAFYYQAKLSFYKQDFTLAADILKNILFNLKDNMANDALELSMLLTTKMNDSLSLLTFSFAELLKEQKKYKESKTEFEKIKNQPQSLLMYNLAQLRLAELELAFDNPDNSISLLVKIYEQSEKSLFADRALFLAAQIFENRKNDYTKAKELYEKLLAVFPSSIYLDEARNSISRIKERIKKISNG